MPSVPGTSAMRVRASDAATQLLELPRQRFDDLQWIADGLPAGHECRRHERRTQSRLQLGDGLAAVQVRERDAVVGARLPSGERCPQLRFAFVEMQHAVGAQHLARTGCGEHQRRFDGGQRHHRRLRRCARAHAVGAARTPEAEQPRRKVRQIARTNRQAVRADRAAIAAPCARCPGEASGRMSENANAPALPRLACAATPSRSISSTFRPSCCSRSAIAAPMMPAPITSTSHDCCVAGQRGQRRIGDVAFADHRNVKPSPTRTRPRGRRPASHRA